MNLYTKQKQTHRRRKQTYGYHRGRRKGQINGMGLTDTNNLNKKLLNHFAVQLKLT